jgi:hypothetical protein
VLDVEDLVVGTIGESDLSDPQPATPASTTAAANATTPSARARVVPVTSAFFPRLATANRF